MERFITNFGEIEAPDEETAEREAYVRWLEDGWQQGGYKPMTREEFERANPEVTLKITEKSSAVQEG